MKKLFVVIGVLSLGAVGACGDDEGGGSHEGEHNADAAPMGADPDAMAEEMLTTLAMDFTGLPQLGGGFVYEGWLVTSDGPVTSGRFVIGDNGMPSPASFELAADVVADSTVYVLTIEPATGDDPAPSHTHVLAGDISAGAADLTTSHGAALGTDFAAATGSYILATPSTADDGSDNPQGIWWLVPGDTPMASLDLPELPAGWVYEGWVVGADGPVTTGRFSAADLADADGTGPTAGPDSGPAFPGQDYIDPAMNLIGGAAVISVEPDPDDGAGPFIIKPLVDGEIEDISPPAGQQMANNAAATLPSGSVTFTAQ